MKNFTNWQKLIDENLHICVHHWPYTIPDPSTLSPVSTVSTLSSVSSASSASVKSGSGSNGLLTSTPTKTQSGINLRTGKGSANGSGSCDSGTGTLNKVKCGLHNSLVSDQFFEKNKNKWSNNFLLIKTLKFRAISETEIPSIGFRHPCADLYVVVVRNCHNFFNGLNFGFRINLGGG